MNSRKIALILAILLFSTLTYSKETSKIKDIKHGGDFRYRYQLDDKDNDTTPQRVRTRLRLRYGAEARLDEKTSVHAGLTTGALTPKSGNQTFENSSSSKSVFLDYAYMQLKMKNGKVLAGKMKNPFYSVSDMGWDSDIRPEGIAIQKKCNKTGVKVTAAYFVIDEVSTSDYDPNLITIQAAKKHNLSKDVLIKGLVTVQSFDNLAGRDLLYSAKSNTGSVGTEVNSYAYSYNPHIVSLASKLVFKNVDRVKNIALFGEYNTNTGVDDANISGLIGAGIGEYKINAKGKWNAKASYRHIQRDGLVDILTDADTFGGNTNVKGVELTAKYGLCDNVVLSFDYITMQDITTDKVENILQTDFSIKF
jgi:hypothetical protein